VACAPGSRLPLRTLQVFALGALAAGIVVAGHGLINAFPYGLTDDDAWFYSRIAYELGTTGRPTFDGIHPTSGFHLLWGGLLGLSSAAVGLFSLNPEVHLYAHEAVYVFIALLVAGSFARRRSDRFSLFALTIVSTMLMETLLVGALLLAFLRLSNDDDTRPARRRLALVALALVPLARIDAAVIPLALAAILLAARRQREAVWIVAAVALGTIVQVALMLAIFGHPFSVSSMIKTTIALPAVGTLVANVRGPESLSPGFVLRALIFLILAVAVFARPVRHHARHLRHLGIAVGVCLFTLVHLVAHRIPFWCYLPAYMVLFYLASQEDRRDLLRRWTVLAIPALLAVFLVDKLLDVQRHRPVVRGARDFVTKLAEVVPPDGRIYQVDGAGFVGFFSGRHVINGDGLVNTYEYADRARRGALGGYLDEEGICFVVDNVDRGGSDIIVNFGGLVIRQADVDEVLRTRTYGQHPTTDFVLYRRRSATCAPAPRS
jgi:hypothetical protein